MFFYENQGVDANGLPKLTLVGPLEADGKPLNVGHWCAAPCAADFDGDGDLDLISGNMPMNALGGDGEAKAATFLRYYENVGTRESARFQEKKFPAQGGFPRASLATPRAADWNGDGKLDLVVSARANVYLIENQGTPSRPQFAANSNPLPSHWSNARIPADQFLDWDADGRLDLFVRGHYSIRLNTGRGNPWAWDEEISILPPGQHIAHPSGIGDDWFWPFLDDFDQDGRVDILFGDWHGHVWFHRNLATEDVREFDLTGRKLRLASGSLLKVGPIDKDLNTDFNALQGARTTLTVADFDRDGRRDLVVGDTYGKVRYFRQSSDADGMVFDDPVPLGDLGIRLLVDAVDWNGDDWNDVIAGAANGNVRVFLNAAEAPLSRFKAGFDTGLPPIAQPRVLMADLNGDGDEDLYLPSTQGSCFVERSFLRHGYAVGNVKNVERRTSNVERPTHAESWKFKVWACAENLSLNRHQILCRPEVEYALRNGGSCKTGVPHPVARQNVEFRPGRENIDGPILGSTEHFAVGRHQGRQNRSVRRQTLLVDPLSRFRIEAADNTVGIAKIQIAAIHHGRGHIRAPM